MPIIENIKNFSMHMVLSGSATGMQINPSHSFTLIFFSNVGTGKSLMQSIWSRVFQGGAESVVTSITENYAHEKLSRGQPVYGN